MPSAAPFRPCLRRRRGTEPRSCAKAWGFEAGLNQAHLAAEVHLEPQLGQHGHVGAELVKNLMVDAFTTSRWYFVISMGRKAGHLALGIGKAAGATLSLIPEEFSGPIRLDTVCDILEGAILKRQALWNRSDGVAVIAEGLLARGERVLVTTLTKRLAEDLSSYIQQAGIKGAYLHSEIETLERVQILTDLRGLPEGPLAPEVDQVALALALGCAERTIRSAEGAEGGRFGRKLAGALRDRFGTGKNPAHGSATDPANVRNR